MTRRQKLVDYLEWLITPQDDKETELFKKDSLVDDYIGLKNRILEMSEEELIVEINIQLKPYDLELDQI